MGLITYLYPIISLTKLVKGVPVVYVVAIASRALVKTGGCILIDSGAQGMYMYNALIFMPFEWCAIDNSAVLARCAITS